ncbi:hypothetical protein V1279_005882 [Bradyrhizobium sp. AZCC 1610]
MAAACDGRSVSCGRMSASAPIRSRGDFDTLLDWLVEGFFGGMLQPLDLILDHQLAALQLDNLQVVCGKVHERFVQFILENLVFTFKFNKMRL